MHLSKFQISRPLSATHWLLRRAIAGTLAVALADFLFYEAKGFGLSLVIFLIALVLLSLLLNPRRAPYGRQVIAGFVFLAGLAALIENVTPLSMVFGIGGVIAGALILVSPAHVPWIGLLRASLFVPVKGPLQLATDMARVRALRTRRSPIARVFDYTGWVIPLLFGGIFLVLFATANPLIESWLAAIDVSALINLFSPYRVIFWALLLCLIWPALHIRTVRAKTAEPFVNLTVSKKWDGLMSPPAVLRSLVLFNALFAVQTAMDIGYLWGGLALPVGMTHAAYAHRGAYPLVATALLAAAFVLIALRDRQQEAVSALIRPLLLVFVGQNILLVLSSILRLDLYVMAYALTYWRVAAFIWMGLVAFGLVLILVRIIWNTPNAWLLGANAAALILTLYACCFVNFPDVIARFNFAHCREVTGAGPQLDRYYLSTLGPRVIPAVDAYRNHFSHNDLSGRVLDNLRQNMAANAIATSRNWRYWSFAAWRLDQYLANTTVRTSSTIP